MNKKRFKIVWFIGFCGVILSSFTLANLAKAEILGSWDDEGAYRPAPVLFLHGFGPGSPTATWTEDKDHHSNIDLKLNPYFNNYFDGYASDSTILKDTRYPYLEVADFVGDYTGTTAEVWRQELIDRNSSVDTYQAEDYYVLTGERNIGDPGWSDKVNFAVNAVLNGYGIDKIVLVCHSMGGLAAREYFRAFNGGNKAVRLITIATPHLGSFWAIPPRLIIRRTQTIGWFMPFMSWRFSPDVILADFYLEQKRLIDIDGDAIRDMLPGGDFLGTLNSNPQPQDVDYFTISGDVRWYNGDALISLNSARGTSVLALKDETVVKAIHENVPIVALEGNPSPLLKFIDYTKPVMEITSPDPNAGYIPEINSLSFNVQGEVSQEYLPADCILKIEIQGEGGGTQLVREGSLQPSDLWNPADENSVVAEFDEEITVSEAGIYTILVTVTNPAGFVSEVKTTQVKLTDIPGTGGGWRSILNLLNQKRAKLGKNPVSVPHPEDIDMDGVFTIRWGTVDILQDYGFTDLANALHRAGYAQTTWSEGFACKDEIKAVLNLMIGGDWRYVLNLLNQKRTDLEKDPVSVPHPEDIDMDGVLIIRQGTEGILEDYGFTGLSDALNCAGYTQATWSKGFDSKNEIRDILTLMRIDHCYLHGDAWGKNTLLTSVTYDVYKTTAVFGYSKKEPEIPDIMNSAICPYGEYEVHGPTLVYHGPYAYYAGCGLYNFDLPPVVHASPGKPLYFTHSTTWPAYGNVAKTSRGDMTVVYQSVEDYAKNKGKFFGKVVSQEEVNNAPGSISPNRNKYWVSCYWLDSLFRRVWCSPGEYVYVDVERLSGNWFKSHLPGAEGGTVTLEAPPNSTGSIHYYNVRFIYSYHL